MEHISETLRKMMPRHNISAKTDTEKFCDEFKELLNKYSKIDEDLIFIIYNIVSKALNRRIEKRKIEHLIKSGPCIECGVDISYLPLSSAHKTQGDAFLNKLKKRYHDFSMRIEDDNACLENSALNYKKYIKYKKDTIEPYFCEDCIEFINDICEYLDNSQEEKAEIKKQKSENFKLKIRQLIKDSLTEDANSSGLKNIWWIKGKFYILKKIYTDVEYDQVKSLPYKVFLKTVYWHIVRKHFLEISGEKCSICNSKDQLNVHHKTYKNHGKEHEHLYDLVVLCKQCHAKYHNKLPGPLIIGQPEERISANENRSK